MAQDSDDVKSGVLPVGVKKNLAVAGILVIKGEKRKIIRYYSTDIHLPDSF
jgi:hypothetical protein